MTTKKNVGNTQGPKPYEGTVQCHVCRKMFTAKEYLDHQPCEKSTA